MMSHVELGLMVGRMVAAPAPEVLTRALRSAEIHIKEEAPSAFSLTFQAARTLSQQDVDLLLLPLLQPFNRIIVTVSILGVPTVLMDGFITKQHLARGEGSQPDTLVVSGLDVSAAMNLEEKSEPWPSMADFEIAALILAEYAMYGVVPMVMPTPISFSNLPLEVTIQQSGTDFSFLRELAGRHGYLFRILPGPVPGTNTAYFGPPNRVGAPLPALTVSDGPGRNVESIRFDYDGLAATTWFGTVLDEEDDMETPVLALVSTRAPPFAAMPAVLVNQPWVRLQLLTDSRLDAIQAESKIQGLVDRASDDVVTVTGTLDVLRYGTPLLAPGVVGVRGAGLNYDGLYYVKEVTHKITPDRFTQDFVLTREGLMTTVPAVVP